MFISQCVTFFWILSWIGAIIGGLVGVPLFGLGVVALFLLDGTQQEQGILVMHKSYPFLAVLVVSVAYLVAFW